MNPKQADLQQTGFVVLKSLVEVIRINDKKEDNIKSLPIDINYDIFQTENSKNKIQVLLDIEINRDKTHNGYKITLSTGGEYEFSDNVKQETEMYKQLIMYSALPCLINQTRLYLKTSTSLFPLGEYILPMLDMKDIIDQKFNKNNDQSIDS